MPHLNELDQKYASRGLTVLGLTRESKDKTEPWVAAKGAKYAYGYDTQGLGQLLGVKGIPASFLVDPTGVVVWKGHPSGVTDELIEKHLEGVISKPIYEWSGDAAKVKQAFVEKNWAKALGEADKLAAKDPFGVEVKSIVQTLLGAEISRLEAALEAGDALSVDLGAKAIAKTLKGLPEEARVLVLLEKLKSDKGLKETLKVQERLQKLTAEVPKRKKDCDEQMGQLKKLLKGHEGSIAGKQIEAKILELFELKERLQY